MSRRHHDLVEVRTCTSPAGPVPDQFLWRGRLYCVREVLACWTESGSWWRGTTARVLSGGPEPAGSVAGSVVLDDQERQWWRVEADSGRLAALTAGPGIYDLCFAERTAVWSLTRVMD